MILNTIFNTYLVKNLKIGQVLIRKVMIMTIEEREDEVDLEVVIENVQTIIQDREDDQEVDHHDVDKFTKHATSLCSTHLNAAQLNSSIQMDFSCIPYYHFLRSK